MNFENLKAHSFAGQCSNKSLPQERRKGNKRKNIKRKRGEKEVEKEMLSEEMGSYAFRAGATCESLTKSRPVSISSSSLQDLGQPFSLPYPLFLPVSLTVCYKGIFTFWLLINRSRGMSRILTSVDKLNIKFIISQPCNSFSLLYLKQTATIILF